MTRLLLVLVVGVATWYGPGFYEQPLYCSCPAQPLYFDEDAVIPWVAVDPSFYKTWGWKCNDLIQVSFSGGLTEYFRARDAGPLSRYYVEDYGPSFPIIIDVAEPFWPAELATQRSSLVKVRNLSLERRIQREAFISRRAAAYSSTLGGMEERGLEGPRGAHFDFLAKEFRARQGRRSLETHRLSGRLPYRYSSKAGALRATPVGLYP